jgi:hypothetical protein
MAFTSSKRLVPQKVTVMDVPVYDVLTRTPLGLSFSKMRSGSGKLTVASRPVGIG